MPEARMPEARMPEAEARMPEAEEKITKTRTSLMSRAKQSMKTGLFSGLFKPKSKCNFTREDEPLLTDVFMKDKNFKEKKRLFKLFTDEIYYFDVNDKNEPTDCMGKILLNKIKNLQLTKNKLELIIETESKPYKPYNLSCITGTPLEECETKIKKWEKE